MRKPVLQAKRMGDSKQYSVLSTLSSQNWHSTNVVVMRFLDFLEFFNCCRQNVKMNKNKTRGERSGVHLPLFYFFIWLDLKNRQANEISKGKCICEVGPKRRTLARYRAE